MEPTRRRYMEQKGQRSVVLADPGPFMDQKGSSAKMPMDVEVQPPQFTYAHPPPESFRVDQKWSSTFQDCVAKVQVLKQVDWRPFPRTKNLWTFTTKVILPVSAVPVLIKRPTVHHGLTQCLPFPNSKRLNTFAMDPTTNTWVDVGDYFGWNQYGPLAVCILRPNHNDVAEVTLFKNKKFPEAEYYLGVYA